MKYFRIRFTTNSKIRGTKREYTEGYIFHIPETESGFYWEIPMFIGNIWDQKIDFVPYTADVKINGKPLDLIETGGPLPLKLLISSNLKNIISKYRKSGYQCFRFNVIRNDIVYDTYWTLHFYNFNPEFIDFPNSLFLYEKHRDDFATSYLTDKIKMRFATQEDFEAHKEEIKKNCEVTTIIKLQLKDNIAQDFFALRSVEGGIGYFVSETLKNEIELAGCTGIEFQPSDLSYNEWVVKGGLRDQIYG